jgi:hypothetical protein
MNSTLMFETANKMSDKGAWGIGNNPVSESKSLYKSAQVMLGHEGGGRPFNSKDINRPHSIEKDRAGKCNCWLCSDLDARFGNGQSRLNRFRIR